MGCLFHGPPNDVDVLVEHRVENIILSNAIGGDFHPLNRRELIPDHLLHGLLQLRIPSITDLCGKTHHIDSLTPTVAPRRAAVINATLS